MPKNRRIFRIAAFGAFAATILGFAFLKPAHSNTSENHFAVLNTALTSQDELVEQLQAVGVKPELIKRVSFRTSTIGKDLGEVESVTYYDRTDQITILPDALGALKGQGGFGNVEVESDPFSSEQLDLRFILATIAEDWDPPKGCHPERGFYDGACQKAGNLLRKAFEEKGFFDPKAMKTAQLAQMEANYSLFVKGSMAPSAFSHWVFGHPKTFSNLPGTSCSRKNGGRPQNCSGLA